MSIYHSYRGSIITDSAAHLGRETIFSFPFEKQITLRQKLSKKVGVDIGFGLYFVLDIIAAFFVKKKNTFTYLTWLGNGMHHYIGKVDFDLNVCFVG